MNHRLNLSILGGSRVTLQGFSRGLRSKLNRMRAQANSLPFNWFAWSGLCRCGSLNNQSDFTLQRQVARQAADDK